MKLTVAMSLFNDKFNQKGSGSGEVKIVDGSTVKSTGIHKIYDCEFELNSVEYAYVVINAQLESYLFLLTTNPAQQNYISTEYEGFPKVYERLSEKYGFDDSLFEEHINAKKQLKACIWRKEHQPTYYILEENHADFNEGFEIQSPKKKFILWDTPLEELRTEKGVQIETNTSGYETLGFAYPVRVGSVILENLEATIHEYREDIPVLNFHTKCYDSTNSERSYWDLRKYFSEEAGLKPGTGWDRSDQKSTPFNLDGMGLSICYTYDSEFSFETGATLLTVENRRDYPAVLVDEEYEKNIAVSRFQGLNKNVYISGDYKRKKQIKRRPPQLTDLCGDQPMVWKDDRNGKIGFASGHYSQVFDEQKIGKITIRNTLPAKGAGRSDMKILLQGNEQKHAVLSGSCHDFDDEAKKIESVIGIPVEFLPEMMDA